MSFPIIDYYVTDYGMVELGEYAATLRRRKNGQFDMRFKAARQLVGAIVAKARDAYMRDAEFEVRAGNAILSRALR